MTPKLTVTPTDKDVWQPPSSPEPCIPYPGYKPNLRIIVDSPTSSSSRYRPKIAPLLVSKAKNPIPLSKPWKVPEQLRPTLFSTDLSGCVNRWFSHPSFSLVNDERIQKICPGFQGLSWFLASDWASVLSITENLPLHYLEIGVMHGASLISVMKTFGTHSDSVFDFIDPFYQPDGLGDTNLQVLRHNLEISGCNLTNAILHREKSFAILPTLPNEYYDLIYVDGNPNSVNVLEDIVMGFRKLRLKGVMVVNSVSDSFFGQPDVQKTLTFFTDLYGVYIQHHFALNGQYVIIKR